MDCLTLGCRIFKSYLQANLIVTRKKWKCEMLFNVYLTTHSLMVAEVWSLWTSFAIRGGCWQTTFYMFILSKAIACFSDTYSCPLQQNPKMSYTWRVPQMLNGWMTVIFQEGESCYSQVAFPLLHLMKAYSQPGLKHSHFQKTVYTEVSAGVRREKRYFTDFFFNSTSHVTPT